MQRRDFLRLVGLSGVAVFTPQLTVWPRLSAAEAKSSSRVLVLVELKGGNDGLNTVVPYGDENYKKLRPRLALPKSKVTPLSEGLGLHEKLSPLMPAWEDEHLAIVNGVGYESPNRSHFRSIEIWETGSDSDEYRQEGWISSIFGKAPTAQDSAADGIILSGSAGPLAGQKMRNVAFNDPKRFARQARRVQELERSGANPALGHLLKVRRDLRKAAQIIEEKHRRAKSLASEFPSTSLGRQLQTAAELLSSKVPVAVIKASLSGFDTHSAQKATHERLLGELSGALSAFRTALKKAQLWDDVLLMTYSEFGRRPAENASGGTDHGTAAPHFLLGGQVKGGLYGKQPSLTDLLDRDLRHHVDYRSLYSTIARDWWQLPKSATQGFQYEPLTCLRSDKASVQGKPKAKF